MNIKLRKDSFKDTDTNQIQIRYKSDAKCLGKEMILLGQSKFVPFFKIEFCV